MRRTKIVATIGPASRDPEVLARMVEAGMDVARLNFSHGSAEEHAETAQRVRAAADRAGRSVAILQDLPGPKLRIGKLVDGFAELKPGDRVTFSCGENSGADGDAEHMHISWAGLAGSVGPDEILYLADGAVRLRVLASRVGEQEIDAVVEIGGSVASRQGLNIPGEAAALPSVPEEDFQHLETGEKIGVDLVALSFVRRAEDIETVRRHTRLPLIAKIEKPQAVQRAEEIVRAADCVMVARGDLGIEMRIEEVPIVQKQIISLAGALARPVITATQMLDSMVMSSRPTRAEVTDVANAILDGTDAVMLSQESAVGQYPVEAVAMLAAIAERTEMTLPYREWNERARAARPARPGLHARLHRLPGGARARARRARVPDALGPLGAADLRPPPDGADLRALPRPRDRPALRAHVGRAGRLDAARGGHRGADQARRAPGRGAGLAQAGRARRDHRRPALGPAGDDQPAPDPDRLTPRGRSGRCARRLEPEPDLRAARRDAPVVGELPDDAQAPTAVRPGCVAPLVRSERAHRVHSELPSSGRRPSSCTRSNSRRTGQSPA